jgi:hypothetical protein
LALPLGLKFGATKKTNFDFYGVKDRRKSCPEFGLKLVLSGSYMPPN